MCRFIAYLGQAIVLHDILYKPAHSLIKQSTHAHEMEEPLNGDGFGISWYIPEIDNLPGLYKSIQPAWNDRNLESLSRKIVTGSLLAHVRAASQGSVNFFNTHPFSFKNYSFMHNGIIGGIDDIRRHLLATLSDTMFSWVKGQTDSELFFALFLDLLQKSKKTLHAKHAISLFNQCIEQIEELQIKLKVKDRLSFINCVISDGKSLMVFRYVSDTKVKANSLYYSFGERLEYQDHHCHMQAPLTSKIKAVLIASEKLTGHRVDWHVLPTNHLLSVDQHLHLELHAI